MLYNPAEIYQQNLNTLQDQIKVLEKKYNVFSILRMIVIFGGIAVLFLLHDSFGAQTYYGIILIIIVFLPLVKMSLKVKKLITFKQALILVNENELAFLAGDLSKFPNGLEFMDQEHPFSTDLDLFGSDSLFQRLNRTCTVNGDNFLAQTILNPIKDRVEILKRQETLKELSLALDWRQDFIASAHVTRGKDYYRLEFAEWLKSPAEFINRKEKLFWTISPIICLILLLAAVFSLLSYVPFSLYFLFQLILTGRYLKNIGKIYSRVSRLSSVFNTYETLLLAIEQKEFKSEELNNIKQEMLRGFEHGGKLGNELPSAGVRKLFNIINGMDAQLNVVMGPILNGLFLWALQYVCKLENWKQQYRSRFPVWLEALGKFDALISMANYTYNSPEFVYPVIDSEGFKIEAIDIAHPFLKSEVRVGNDLYMEAENLIILTGANMAGKSTFLRSIGVNLILAMTGLPVCAASLTFYPIDIYSSLRTSDSISKNESFFLAELKKLQRIIEAYESGIEVFIFLDEILKGTNSRDQHTGSEKLIRKLVRLNARGIIATHDVDLGVLASEMPQNIRNACFEVEIVNDEFIFDYRLKPGICKTMNASVLMKKMNIIDA